MRAQRVIATAGVVAFGLAVLVACGDIFHSTDFPTLCDIDAQARGCPGEAGQGADVVAEAATDFCLWPADIAATHAAYACAWLSACELPLGNNAFGPCMIQAILAYDCAANPNRRVRGNLHDLWDALWQAKSCADVDLVVFPGRPRICLNGGGGTTCGPKDIAGDNSATRAECDEAGAQAGGEPCIMLGRTCDIHMSCAVGSGSCAASTCTGSVLHECEDAGDLGLDCQYFGSGSCDDTGSYPACVPNGANTACDASTAVTCAQSQANGCATGVVETVNCSAFGGSAGAACVPGTPTPVWDVSAACVGRALAGDAGAGDGGDAGACPTATCSGTDTLSGCSRGFTFTTSCSNAGLGSCNPAMTADGTSAACGKR